MRLTIKLLAIFLTAAFLFSSCEEEKLVLSEANSGYQYYPVESGKYWLYRVDSTVIVNAGVPPEMTTSFVREEISESFINSQGDTAYVIQRSVSPTRTGLYNFSDRWILEKTRSGLTRIEENLQFLKILFPVIIGDTWEGNKFDQKTEVFVAQQRVEVYKEWDYLVKNKSLSLTVAGVDYDDILVIQQANYSTDIEIRQSTEYYAPNVGMISKEMNIFDTQCLQCTNETWLEKANRGFKLTQTLLEHN